MQLNLTVLHFYYSFLAQEQEVCEISVCVPPQNLDVNNQIGEFEHVLRSGPSVP